MTINVDLWLQKQDLKPDLLHSRDRLQDIRHFMNLKTPRSFSITSPASSHTKAERGIPFGIRQLTLHLQSDTFTERDKLGVKGETYNTCPHAVRTGPGNCTTHCISVTGRMGLSTSQNAMNKRMQWLVESPQSFVSQLLYEIDTHVHRSLQAGEIPVIRLNGTSDIRWERSIPWIFEMFPDAVFFDYTKWPVVGRPNDTMPENYHLAQSANAAKHTWSDVVAWLEQGRPVSMIVKDYELLMDYANDDNVFVHADVRDDWMTPHANGAPTVGLLKPKHPLPSDHGSVYEAAAVYQAKGKQ